MEELKKCPFCGGEAWVRKKDKRDFGLTIWCECKKCYAKTSGYCPGSSDKKKTLAWVRECKKLAIEAWNRRVD